MATAPPPDESGRTLPATSEAGVAKRARAEDTISVAEARHAAAKYAEAATAMRLAWWTTALVGLLLVLAAVADSSITPVSLDAAGEDTWAHSLVSLVLLLVALQLVSVLLAVEHLADDDRFPVAVWLLRLLVLVSVGLAIVLGRWGPLDHWGEAFVAGLTAELAALLALAVTSAVYPKGERVPPAEVHVEEVPPVEEDPDRVWAIGASGGGIRAAAFVLGGHQAIQDDAVRLHIDQPAAEPHVFAVSGGSYMAAALALRRTFEGGTGRKLAVPTPFGRSYRLDSPELERLRRHTRYLFEPVARTRDGLVSLVMGMVLNLFIVGVGLLFVAWLGSQFAMSVGLVTPTPCDATGDASCTGEIVSLHFAKGWSWQDWLLVLGLPLVLVLAIVGLTWASWAGTAAFDNAAAGAQVGVEEEEASSRKRAMRVMRWAARSRPVLAWVAAAWLFLVVVLPGATVGVSALTTSNQPTTTGASALRALGFATGPMCVDAFVREVRGAVDRANLEARISPGEKRTSDAGACGQETTVSRTVETTGAVVPADDEAARALAGNERVGLQVAGVSALLGVVAGLLRRGPSPEASAETRWFGRLKRVLLTWLPLGIILGIALYLTLRWTFGFLVAASPDHTFWIAGLTALACTLAYLVDANATSLHSFYRSALSDAFAVGIDPVDHRAKELPPANVYRFSDLSVGDTDEPGGYPRLHIVTTLNTQAPNEAPTMRGGFPFVFGHDEVNVFREEGRRVHVGTRTYEEFAGPGRVSIMAAVATSGAAISPLMGRFAVQMAPYRMLLALFNIRVGTWVRNPLHASDRAGHRHGWDGFLWLTRKPGLAQVALEAAGRSSATERWIYLSDGGHLDNTGLVESVRHCVSGNKRGRVVVLDASNDPVDTWSAVGDAVGVVRADMGVDLQRVTAPEEPPWMRRYQGSGLDVTVVKAVRVEPPAEGQAGPDWLATLPPNVLSFQLVHKDFPRASTARQKFGDLEFEAYRALGYAVTKSALEVSLAPAPAT